MRRFTSVLALVVVLGVLQQQLCLATHDDKAASNEELKNVTEIMQTSKATEVTREIPVEVPAEAPAEFLPNVPAKVAAEVPAAVLAEFPTEMPAQVPEKKDSTLAAPEAKNPLDQANSKELSEKASLPESSRKTRQLWFSPNLLYLQPRVGMDGDKCVTNAGVPGTCVRFGQCLPNYRRRSRLLAYVTLREWSIPVPSIGDEICSFYDQFGRANSGVCCPQSMQYPGVVNPSFNPAFNNLIPFDLGGGLGPVGGAIPQFPSVQPIPQPPTIDGGPQKMDPEYTDDDTDVIDNPSPDDPLEFGGGDSLNKSKENEDQENVIYDPVEDPLDPTPMTYNDMRYQWAAQFPSHFNGIQQWPPPLPTHPPSHGSWPPPIPTHPPNHHYPTHPPSSSSGSSSTHTTTTKRPPTKQPVTTTTRRYPGFPQHPQHPAPSPTTTTKRPPTSLVPSGGSSSHGLPSQCGIKNPAAPDQERIVGGINASPHEFPWIAVLFKSGKQFCGGSLITPNHILTAAHCVARMTSWDVAAMTAHLGDYNIRTDYEVQHVQRRIKRLVRHKGFTFSTLHNDIAILTVNEPVKFTREIQPICLPTSSMQQTRSYSGHLATVAGWGSLRENGPQPSTLQKVQIPIWTNGECARKYGGAAPAGIIESMLCAGQAAKDSCSGDSGGPLIVHEGGRYTQVGIVSWGIGCGKGEYPGVYTRVTALLPWIYKNIK